MSMTVPSDFATDVGEREPDPLLEDVAPAAALDGAQFLRRLPGILEEQMEAWNVRPDGPMRHGSNAVVLPVMRGGEPLALKVSWPHHEARHEHLALRAWNGQGAVRLVAAAPAHFCLLLERCAEADDLAAESTLDACEIIGAMQARLLRPALPQLDTASSWCHRIGERIARTPPALPRRFLDQAAALARDIPTDEGVNGTLVHADLHDGNAMRRAERGGGHVAIDPKPLAGEPALTVAPLLWNRWDEARTAYNLRNHLRFRVDFACDPLGVDPKRAREWSILRLVDNACGLDPTQDGRELTKIISIIKALHG